MDQWSFGHNPNQKCWIERLFSKGVGFMKKTLKEKESYDDKLISATYAQLNFSPWKMKVSISFKEAEITNIFRNHGEVYGNSYVLLGSGFIGGDGLPFGKFDRLHCSAGRLNYGSDSFGGLFESEEEAKEVAKQFLEEAKKNMEL